MFCSNCGKQIEDGAAFCPFCGTKLSVTGQDTYSAGQPYKQDDYTHQDTGEYGGMDYQYNYENHWSQYPPGYAGQLQYIGFSDRIHSPEFIEALKKSKKASAGCAAIFIPIPLIIYIIAFFATDEITLSDVIFIGGGISLFFLLAMLISTAVKASKKQWDGTVIEKDHKITKARKKDSRGNARIEETEWEIVKIRKDNGSIHEISEPAFGNSYAYLNVGDRVRFHPNLGFSYHFEKYDKSRDKYTVCMFCNKKTKLNSDYCDHCKHPILK